MTNKAVARHLKLAADLIELTGGNPFRARAFAGAARAIDRLNTPVAAHDGDLAQIPGLGKGIAAEVRGLLATGRLEASDRLLATLPPGLPDVLRVRGLGVKKVRALWQGLGVDSLDALEGAAVSGRMAELEGFGAKTAESVLASIAQLRSYAGQLHVARALPEALALLQALQDARGVGRASLAGGLRRQAETVAEATLVAEASAQAVAKALAEGGLADVASAGDTVTATLGNGLPLRVICTAPEAYGRVLWAETGSEAHLALFRRWCQRRGLHGEPPDTPDEDEVYARAGLAPVPPPLREGTDELDRAARGPFPTPVRTADLRGTLHNHSTYSDGANTLAEMAEAARSRGLEYFGIADHSRSLQVAHGLSPERLDEQIREVEALNAGYAGQGFRVFSGSEVDILADGSLDYDDALLARLDVVVASVHTHFAMTADEATDRLVRAVRNPHVAVLGHATGRLLLRREGYPIHAEAVLDACAECGVSIELNANPWRLDLDWRLLRGAAERGVPVSINPDAHAADELDNVQWGVAVAQKAGLEPSDVLNARSADELASWLDARKA